MPAIFFAPSAVDLITFIEFEEMSKQPWTNAMSWMDLDLKLMTLIG